MQKRQLTSLLSILLTSLLIFGCSSADRENSTADTDNIVTTPTVTEDNTTTESNSSVTATIEVDARNAYKVAASFSDTYLENGYYTKESIGSIHYEITNIYTDEAIDTSVIQSITLEAEDKESDTNGTYFDFITFSGSQGPIYEIPASSVEASSSVALKTKTLSGTTNLIIRVVFQLEDALEPKTLTMKVPMVIEKNLNHSMAIEKIGSRYENGLFIDKFVIQVVDSYGNKAADGTAISTGVINNPKRYSNAYNGATQKVADNYAIHLSADNNFSQTQTYTTTNLDDQTLPFNPNNSGRIIGYDYSYYYQYITTTSLDEDNNTIESTTSSRIYYPSIFDVTYKNDTGSLNKSNGTFTLSPADVTDLLDSKITEEDTLIILANKDQHYPENLGGWDIKSINSDSEISLHGLDLGTDINGVSYVIGDEYRYIDYQHTIINAAASTFETTNIIDGLAYAELRYVPEMVGKNVFIYANTRLDDKHIGISRKILLHGTGQNTETVSCTNDKGQRPDCTVSVYITLNDEGEGMHIANPGGPINTGSIVYNYATATFTGDTGWTQVSIYGIDENKTATVEIGGLLADEYVINQK